MNSCKDNGGCTPKPDRIIWVLARFVALLTAQIMQVGTLVQRG